jgi:glycosyltransferase involved in cell wall biosynthesis
MNPKYNEGNKYNQLLSDSIEKKGYSVIHLKKKHLLFLKKRDVFHTHWPSGSYRGKSIFQTIIKSALFIGTLLYLKLRGVKIIWTAHNVWPHSSGKTSFDKLMRTILAKFCSNIIVMGDSVVEEICANFKVSSNKVKVIPHGHYKDAYPCKGTNIRKLLKIPEESFVFGFLGQISPYKGVNKLIESFKLIDNKNCYLIIAGRLSPEYKTNFLNDIEHERIKVKIGFIEDEDIVDYVKAFDVMVLPYDKITTSGSAILSISFGIPVVAPKAGLLNQYIPKEAGILYEGNSIESLRNAMANSIYLEKSQIKESCNKKLKELDWEKIAHQVVSLY